MGIGEITGDEADEAAAGAGVFDVGHAFELLGAAEVAGGIDELFDGGVDDSEEGNPDHGVIDPSRDFFARSVGDGDADEEEEGEGDEEPEEVIAREAIERPSLLGPLLGPAEGIEGR